MDVSSFLLYLIAWYLFGTVSAFAAALLFWKKGRSTISGHEPGSGLGLRLSGAAGIFVAVLLVIHFINPLKLVINPDKLLLVYSAAVESALEGDEAGDRSVRYTLKSSQAIDAKLLNEHVSPKLIDADHVYELRRSADRNAFVTAQPIPTGTYELHLSDAETGELTTFYVDVPSPGEENES